MSRRRADAADRAAALGRERVLARALGSGGDFAEVFCEERSGFGLAIDESRVERVQRGGERGAGVRVVEGETTYFAHVDGLAEADLERAARRRRGGAPRRAARAAGAAGRRAAEPSGDRGRARRRCRPSARPSLLRACDERARAAGDEIAQVHAELRRGPPPGHGRQLRRPARQRRPHPGPARRPGRRPARTAPSRPASRRSAAIAASSSSRAAPARRSPSRRRASALTLLDAEPAPAGAMPVVVGGGFGGVLFHEMTGHGLEADHIQKGASVYAGKLGEQVAPSRSSSPTTTAACRASGAPTASTTRARPRRRRR